MEWMSSTTLLKAVVKLASGAYKVIRGAQSVIQGLGTIVDVLDKTQSSSSTY